MKKAILFLSLSFICTSLCNAQSNELRNAFSQVSTTLKDYKYKSEDVFENDIELDYAYTKSITVKLQGGYIIFTIVDDFTEFTDPFFGHKHGTKTIKAPISTTEVLDSELDEGILYLYCEDGLEYSYKGQKELMEDFAFHSTPLNVKKLYRELGQLLTIAKEEKFNGNLGGSQPTNQRPARRRR